MILLANILFLKKLTSTRSPSKRYTIYENPLMNSNSSLGSFNQTISLGNIGSWRNWNLRLLATVTPLMTNKINIVEIKKRLNIR